MSRNSKIIAQEFQLSDEGYICNSDSWLHPDNVFSSVASKNKEIQPISFNSSSFEHKCFFEVDRVENPFYDYTDPNRVKFPSKPKNTEYGRVDLLNKGQLNKEYQDTLLKSTYLPPISAYQGGENQSQNRPSNDTNDLAADCQKYLPKSLIKVRRADLGMRSSLRFLRKYFQTLFRASNPNLVRRRFVNCSFKEISEGMKKTLLQVLPRDLVTAELVIYTAGIMNCKNHRRLHLVNERKQEIEDFLETIRKFSLNKLLKVLSSHNLHVLAQYLVNKSDDPRVDKLREVLQTE